ncbi:unnamed protein product [Porites lobata]|uniref:Transposase n=1 Tax=Porites lobata TaxID=104759 RepID=A0ABN8PUW8_9CNID|nr:unnamed protein product [Porites lobata]
MLAKLKAIQDGIIIAGDGRHDSTGHTLSEWIKPCERHLHWSATSTFNGSGRVILAKFKGFLNHVINNHSGFRTLVYETLCEALSNKALVRGIKQASPHAQTSCLECFHSVLNHFAPKMIVYSYVGMYKWHILAAVHFNFNLHREVKSREKDGV